MGGGGKYIAHTSLGQIVVYKYGYMSVQTYFGNVPVKKKKKIRNKISLNINHIKQKAW